MADGSGSGKTSVPAAANGGEEPAVVFESLSNANGDGKGAEKEAMLEEKHPRRPKRFSTLTLLKYTSLLVLVVQNAGQVLIMRYALTRDQPQFLKTVVVFLNEVVKLVASFLLLVCCNGPAKALQDIHHHFIENFLDTLKVGVPAFVYTIQNILLYVAVAHLDAGTYMVTYQLKILTTALFTVLMLKRRLSVAQWAALVVLILGVAIVQISAKASKSAVAAPLNVSVSALSAAAAAAATTTAPLPPPTQAAQNPVIGFFCVIAACFLSGFAGIYFEKILKDAAHVSIWLRNLQLAFLSIPIGAAVIAASEGQRVLEGGLLQGFDLIVWCVVVVQALGGLIVAVVIKYADNILKAFATSIAIIVSSVASIYLFIVYPKPLFIAGAALVIGAVVIYGAFPYRQKKKKVDLVVDLDNPELGLELEVEVPEPAGEDDETEAEAAEGDTKAVP